MANLKRSTNGLLKSVAVSFNLRRSILQVVRAEVTVPPGGYTDPIVQAQGFKDLQIKDKRFIGVESFNSLDHPEITAHCNRL